MSRLISRVHAFAAELRRRRVFRVVIVYAFVAWGVIQVAETTFPYLDLPHWTVTLVIVLSVLGFPLALVLAWAFDITPQGVQRTEPRTVPRPEADAGARPAEALAPTEEATGPSRAGVPTPPVPLVGREREMADLRELLTDEGVRLLTLTGPGGIGKSRLAIAVASELGSGFDDGAAFVPLAAVRDPELVTSTIARALGIQEERDRGLLEVLQGRLRERELLLVLDDFEQVLPAAPVVAELLWAAPRLKALVTSREALRVRGEQEYPVPPLRLPALTDSATPEEFEEHPAVRLFVERARSVEPRFELGSENARSVAEICVRLDGLPLAIELAATRVKTLPPAALLQRLERRLELLTGGARDLPERQRTLRQTIAWSYELLEDPERRLFRWLAVFASGFTLEAAEAVAGAGNGDRECVGTGAGFQTLDGLTSLIDKNLVVRERAAEDEPRFRMLETIREYALERLAESGEEGSVRQAHLAHFLGLAEMSVAGVTGPDPVPWLRRLETEHDNLREALNWLERKEAPAIGLRLCLALWRFWETRGYLSEGRARLVRFLESGGRDFDPRLRVKGLYAAGVLSEAQGDYDAARRFFAESLEIFRELEDQVGVANALNNLGIVALRRGDRARARRLYEESLALWRQLGHRPAAALSLKNLGNVAAEEGDYSTARGYHQESLTIFRDLGDRRGIAWSLERLGHIAFEAGEYEEADAFYDQSLEIFRALGDAAGMASVRAHLGDLACERGDSAAAASQYARSLKIFYELGDRRNVARLLENFAVLAVTRDRAERALRLAGAASRIRDTFSAPLAPVKRSELQARLEPARRQLGGEGGEEAFREGREMTLEQARRYALTDGER